MARSAVTHIAEIGTSGDSALKIDSELKGANALSSNPTGFVCSLGAFEEIYWLFSQTRPKGFAYAAEIEGRTIVDAWLKALDQVAAQRTNPRGSDLKTGCCPNSNHESTARKLPFW
jgi:hypothetical protein